MPCGGKDDPEAVVVGAGAAGIGASMWLIAAAMARRGSTWPCVI
jgi:cation diffusion facilitator CzcD-associated flavoprotein CzcO